MRTTGESELSRGAAAAAPLESVVALTPAGGDLVWEYALSNGSTVLRMHLHFLTTKIKARRALHLPFRFFPFLSFFSFLFFSILKVVILKGST